MSIDLIKELLIQIDKNLKIIEDRMSNLNIESKFNELKKIRDDENFWKNENQIEITKEFKKYEDIVLNFNDYKRKYNEILELLEIYKDDLDFISEIFKEVRILNKNLNKLSIDLLMNKDEDDKNCFLDINSGAGGTEAQDWADMLLRMYIRFFELNNLKYDLIDHVSGEGAGIKSATLFVKGNYANGLLSCENGIHRLVRISPFDSNKRRHTSFAAVLATPEVPDILINIDSKDLRIDTYRAGGAGGQHVNKTDSAVRITHFPTGIVVQCQNERSQLQNKDVAMKMLKARIFAREKELQNEKKNNIEKKKIEWGSQIRSYVLHPYKMVKDHRTEHESPQPEKVLDGEIIDFIEKYLIIR